MLLIPSRCRISAAACRWRGGTSGLPAVYATYQPGLPEALDIAVVTDDCVRIGFYAGVVAGAPNESLGGRLIDFMGEPLFQFGVSDRFRIQTGPQRHREHPRMARVRGDRDPVPARSGVRRGQLEGMAAHLEPSSPQL